uniref:Uncharacterized protein n=1 Tax=Megaselia scalaris TaxID=36166 RepID=T1GLV4_MEGSC
MFAFRSEDLEFESLKTFAKRVFSDFSKVVQNAHLSKMVVKHYVKGYEEFRKLVEDLKAQNEIIHVLFSGFLEERKKRANHGAHIVSPLNL